MLAPLRSPTLTKSKAAHWLARSSSPTVPQSKPLRPPAAFSVGPCGLSRGDASVERLQRRPPALELVEQSLETVDGAPAEPQQLTSAVPNWGAGDTIHLGKRTLRVIGKRDDDADQPSVLIVEDQRPRGGGP